MILEYYRKPETGENWLKVRQAGATVCELYRPVTNYAEGASVLHLDRFDRSELERLAAMGLRPKVRATRSDVYTLRRFGRYGVSVESNIDTTTREPHATLVIPHAECYELVDILHE